jgi:3-hydroxyisobutyrate dehydrogenase-like beta-hydroxyacid dehydrogenase
VNPESGTVAEFVSGFRVRGLTDAPRNDEEKSMPLTVAIVAAGAMGSGVARRLADNGVAVLTSLAGRSEASAARAAAAGMRAADDAQLVRADLFLSIVPPGDSRALAERFAPHLAAADRKPVFIDCNAVSPATMRGNAEVIAAAGARFVAAAIIGPPPKPGSTNTKLYVSGPAAAEAAKLNDHGLAVRRLDGPLTAASALKMSYAGITKGFTALAAGMMLAATRDGSAEALKAELAESQPAMTAWLDRQMPNMYAKAYRWVAELDEIGAFVGEEFPEHAMLAAAARFYRRIADDHEGKKDEIAVLDRFLARG